MLPRSSVWDERPFSSGRARYSSISRRHFSRSLCRGKVPDSLVRIHLVIRDHLHSMALVLNLVYDLALGVIDNLMTNVFSDSP